MHSYVAESAARVRHLAGWAMDHRAPLDGLQVLRPSLEDIYLSLTGPPSGQGSQPAPAGKQEGRTA